MASSLWKGLTIFQAGYIGTEGKYVALPLRQRRAICEAAVQGIKINHPIGRMGRPDELGGGVVYLCSEAASFVTCSELVIDGGFTAI